ncbi:MAG TPA: glutamine amidotransferase [Firmicutes bacterium]|nr:glutamine amidotransferase [Bacillota bacterium]
MIIQTINIYQLYPDHWELYGDQGNIMALVRRLGWHDLKPRLVAIPPGSRVSLKSCHILYMGDFRNTGAKTVAADLKRHRQETKERIEDGMVLLATGSSYQWLGQYYRTISGEQFEGLGLVNCYSVQKEQRLTGELIVKCCLWSPPKTLVGFENHDGQTYPGLEATPLGQVLSGYGNNQSGETEGIVYKNVIGTYMHGSLLPRNPWLTDYLLQRALQYLDIDYRLSKLDDSLEEEAHRTALQHRLPFTEHQSKKSLFRFWA